MSTFRNIFVAVALFLFVGLAVPSAAAEQDPYVIDFPTPLKPHWTTEFANKCIIPEIVFDAGHILYICH